MGILGMMAAGGAVGLADASNKQVAAQQQMEMEGMRADRVDQREALRQQYLERNFNIERQDRKDMAKAQMQMEELKYNRNRADKLTDAEMTHKQKLELEGMKESGRDRRSAASIAAANKRAADRMAATGGGGAAGGGGARSSQGKLIEDMISMGIAKDPTEAYNLATRSDVLRAALQNPLAQISSDTLIDEVSKLVEGLGPTRGGGGLLTGGKPAVPEVSFELDPKTGKLVPNGR